MPLFTYTLTYTSGVCLPIRCLYALWRYVATLCGCVFYACFCGVSLRCGVVRSGRLRCATLWRDCSDLVLFYHREKVSL